jgi:hypothetical protein
MGQIVRPMMELTDLDNSSHLEESQALKPFQKKESRQIKKR